MSIMRRQNLIAVTFVGALAMSGLTTQAVGL
jgi:hypothetical protein